MPLEDRKGLSPSVQAFLKDLEWVCRTHGFQITEEADFVERAGDDGCFLPGVAIFELDDCDEPVNFTHIFDYTGED